LKTDEEAFLTYGAIKKFEQTDNFSTINSYTDWSGYTTRRRLYTNLELTTGSCESYTDLTSTLDPLWVTGINLLTSSTAISSDIVSYSLVNPAKDITITINNDN
jgi:hypothetical protein